MKYANTEGEKMELIKLSIPASFVEELRGRLKWLETRHKSARADKVDTLSAADVIKHLALWGAAAGAPVEDAA
jgi:hypothetical protein